MFQKHFFTSRTPLHTPTPSTKPAQTGCGVPPADLLCSFPSVFVYMTACLHPYLLTGQRIDACNTNTSAPTQRRWGEQEKLLGVQSCRAKSTESSALFVDSVYLRSHPQRPWPEQCRHPRARGPEPHTRLPAPRLWIHSKRLWITASDQWINGILCSTFLTSMA